MINDTKDAKASENIEQLELSYNDFGNEMI
jgi:hypothetical protein